MKQISILATMLVMIMSTFLLQVGAMAGSSSVTYSIEKVHNTRVNVIWIDLNDKSLKVTPAVGQGRIGRRQSFVSFLAQHQPLALLTGSFFSLDNSIPIGDIVINRKVVFRGPIGTAIAIKPNNRAEMMNIPYGWPYSWPGYESVLKGGIRLLENGEYAAYPRRQGFRDPALFRRATRTAVGLDKKGRLLMVAVGNPIYLSDLASIMKGLGCRDAMSLDGGTSTGLAFGSSVIFMPGRTLSTVLMVVQRPEPPTPKPKTTGATELAEPTEPTPPDIVPTSPADEHRPVSPPAPDTTARLSLPPDDFSCQSH